VHYITVIIENNSYKKVALINSDHRFIAIVLKDQNISLREGFMNFVEIFSFMKTIKSIETYEIINIPN
jgi:hypothetical protein